MIEAITLNTEATETMKVDLHCHTEASNDCITPLIQIPDQMLTRGITVQAITDHNEIWGAQKLAELVTLDDKYKDLQVIVGEEISTNEGEIIGLFLTERIAPGLSPEDTVAAIKNQGGLVLLPHAFDPLKRFRLSPVARERIKSDIDIIESFNARISQPKWNDTASLWAAEHDVAQSAGSDAHTLKDIGTAWTLSPKKQINTPEDLLVSLRTSHVQGIWTHPVIAFLYKAWYWIQKKLLKHN